MKRVSFIALAVAIATGCSPKREVVDVINGTPGTPGQDGTSCSVADYSIGEEVLGAKISCTDGSYAIILNGSDGVNGLNGLDGEDGTGVTNITNVINVNNTINCSVGRESEDDYATVTCGEDSVRVYDGDQGDPGDPGSDGAGSTLSSFSIPAGKEKSGPDEDGDCVQIDTNASARRNGNSSEIKLYNSTNCSGSSTALNDGEVAVTTSGSLVFNVEGSNDLKVLTFSQGD